MKLKLMSYMFITIFLNTSMVTFTQAESLKEYQLRQFYKKNEIEDKAKKTKELKSYSNKVNKNTTVSNTSTSETYKPIPDFDAEQNQKRLNFLQTKRNNLYEKLLRTQDSWEEKNINEYSRAKGIVEDINDGKCDDIIGKPCSRPQAKRIKLKHQEIVDNYDNLRKKVVSSQEALKKLDNKIEGLEERMSL